MIGAGLAVGTVVTGAIVDVLEVIGAVGSGVGVTVQHGPVAGDSPFSGVATPGFASYWMAATVEIDVGGGDETHELGKVIP
jgi:hypothetical protein